MNLSVTVAVVSDFSVLSLAVLCVLACLAIASTLLTTVEPAITQYLTCSPATTTVMSSFYVGIQLLLTCDPACEGYFNDFLLTVSPFGDADDPGYSSLTIKRSYKSFVF